MVNMKENLYQKEDPPNQSEGSVVAVNLTLISFGSFQEIEMAFSVKFLLQLQWYVNSTKITYFVFFNCSLDCLK